MADQAEAEAKFWKSLRKDMTGLLGLVSERGSARPMTAQLDDDGFDGDDYRGPIWFFTSTDTIIAEKVASGSGEATFHFASKGHDVWATVDGTLSATRDRAVIDRLWNPHAAAWYEQGKDDPKLVLLRFDASEAQIWLDASSVVAGIKALFGVDPKQDAPAKPTTVAL